MQIPRLAKSAAFALALLSAAQITLAQTNTQTPDTGGATTPEKGARHHHAMRCDQHEDWQSKRKEMNQKFAKDLDLTSDQKTKIDSLRQAFYDEHKSEMDAQKARFQEMCKMKESGATKEEIHAKMKGMPQPNMEGMKADHEKLDQQIRAVLTPEQAKKFDTMKAERAKHWQEGKKMHETGEEISPSSKSPY